MYGPVIQGKLVRLRPPRAEDAEVMITWFDDLEVTRFIMRRHPPSIEEEKTWLENLAKDPNVIQRVVEFQGRSEEHTSELQSRFDLVCRLLLEKKKGRSALHVS